MRAASRSLLIGCVFVIFTGWLNAQPAPIPPGAQPPKVDAPPSRDLVAARVNGQTISELAVYRGLLRYPAAQRADARTNVLNFLVDTAIVDQYLIQLKLPIDSKEVDQHIQQAKDEAAKEKKDFKALLAELHINEEELRSEMTSALRWDKFVLQQGTDKVLKEMFERNPDMFNGSRVRARHILVKAKDGKVNDAQAAANAIKKNIEADVDQVVSKLKPLTDAIVLEKERAKALEKFFAEAAVKYSNCPSSKDGGDLDYFPRAGAMVEPFARVAFALKPYQLSDPVATEFGVHLILPIDYRPGKEVKFDQVKPFVQEVYSERLREAVLTAYKAKSKIEILEKR